MMLRRSVQALRQRRAPILYASAATTAVTTYYVFTAQTANADTAENEIGFRKLPQRWDPPTRAQMLKALQTGKRAESGSVTRVRPEDDTPDESDLLVVGGEPVLHLMPRLVVSRSRWDHDWGVLQSLST